jgi:hypothetical protein
VPSRRRLALDWAVDEPWALLVGDDEDGAHGGEHEGEPSPAEHTHDAAPPRAVTPPAPGARTILVWRHDLTVYHRPLEPLEAAALARAADGAPFGGVCDLLAERLPVEEAGPVAFQLLARWVQDGLIARS